MWNQTVPFFKRTKILGTACEFGLSLISLTLSECMSHLGLNTNIKFCQCLGRGSIVKVCARANVSIILPQELLWKTLWPKCHPVQNILIINLPHNRQVGAFSDLINHRRVVAFSGLINHWRIGGKLLILFFFFFFI